MATLGFIGLGVMGVSMATHLLNAGHELVVYTRTQSKAQPLLALGAKWVETPQAVAQQADVVFTIVGYPKDVDEVYNGEVGLFSGSRPGQIFVDMTTSTPSLAQTLYQKGQQLGVQVLDAPVSGGDLGAKEARLTTMVGGDKATFEAVEPYLACFSAKMRLQGAAGAGQHTKMANQIMIAGTMLGMTELLVYAKAMQLSLEDVLGTVGAGSAANWSLANYAPRILREDYSPGFFAKHFLKDLKIALDEAERLELKLPATQLAAQLYQQLCENGHENDGTQALIKLWWQN
ncbi:MAG: NAD(P)-dependent oxidoreductase [Aerococcaceae bacterium]|nr:NAD(P)-dependent oxidoreductase [Aerococcaceae bacterium]